MLKLIILGLIFGIKLKNLNQKVIQNHFFVKEEELIFQMEDIMIKLMFSQKYFNVDLYKL